MYTKIWKSFIEVHFLVISTLFAGIFSVLFITSKSFDLDEIYSVKLAQNNLAAMFHTFWNYDGNAWFYYLLLHFWIRFGANELIVRLLSALFATLTIPIIYFLGKTVGINVGRLAVWLLILNAYFIAYAQEARPYSLLLFLTGTSSLFFIKCIAKPSFRNFLLYVITFALAIYTHFFALLVLISHFLTILIKRNIVKKMHFYISYLFILMLSIPLFISPAFHVGQLVAQSVSLKEFAGIILAFSGGLPLTLLIFLGLIFWKIYNLINSRFKKIPWRDYFFIIYFLFPVLFAFIFSVLAFSIYSSRYLIICLIPFMILSSQILILINKRSKKLSRVFILSLILLSSFSLAIYYADNMFFFRFWSISKQTEDWRGAANYIKRNAKSSDAVTFYIYYILQPFDYYLNSTSNMPHLENMKRGDYLLDYSAKPDPKNLNYIVHKYKRLWLVLSHYHFSKLRRDKNAQDLLAFYSKHYYLTQKITFRGDITIYLFAK